MKKITFILLVCSLFANVTNNGATVTIGSDVNVYVDGNFTNNGTLTNNGYLEILGLFTGDGTLFNNGTLLFDNTGDLSQDGNINITDIILLVEAVLAISEGGETSDEALLYGDIYPDGQLNIVDIVGLVNISLNN